VKTEATSYKSHLNRLKSAVYKRFSLTNVPDWIEENTYLKGEKFSFVDHEFQLKIITDQSREIVVRKCSQVGMSELLARRTLAMSSIMQGFTSIYTLPTASFANTFVKTRVDPIIEGSPVLTATAHDTTNNTEVKRFGESFIFFKGTKGAAAAISIPADALVHDELDFSDLEVVTNYQSRLTHSKHKLKANFSTPTVAGYGVSELFENSRKHYNFCKCNHCNHQFVPDYYEHVKIQGAHDLRTVNKDTIHKYKLETARLECPKCHKQPSLQVEHREWVIENPTSNHEAAGYQISPFDAPNIISVRDLVSASAKYARVADFINFNLGLPAEDSEVNMSLEDIKRCFVPGEVPAGFSTVMGLDMGMTCHCMIGFLDYTGCLHTVHTEEIPLMELDKRRAELQVKFRVRLTVMDSMPYTDTMLRFQAQDPNLYGAIYVVNKGLETFRIKSAEEFAEKGQQEYRQVNINKNNTFDALMETIRAGKWLCVVDENMPTIIAHLRDQKRIQEFTRDQEMSFVWKKSARGVDHFHHALLYLWVASRMSGVAGSIITLPSLVHSFKQTEVV
jgi:hypothetical protein